MRIKNLSILYEYDVDMSQNNFFHKEIFFQIIVRYFAFKNLEIIVRKRSEDYFKIDQRKRIILI